MSIQKTKKGFLFSSFVDALILIASIFGTKYFLFEETIGKIHFSSVFITSWILLWLVISVKLNLYEQPRIVLLHQIISKNLRALFFFILLTGGLIFFTLDDMFSPLFLGASVLVFSTGILIWRIAIIYFLKKSRRRGLKDYKVIVVGMNKNVGSLIDGVFSNSSYGFQIEGLFTDATQIEEYETYRKGNLAEVVSFLEQTSIDEIIISLPYTQSKLINELIRYADNHMIRVNIIPEFSEYLSQVFSIDYIENIPIMKLRKEPLQSFTNRILKRAFDVGFSLAVVIFVLSWLFPVIALAIKLTSKGPVFFAQERTGKDGRPFKCLKFRSMVVNGKSDSLQAVKNDARVTRVGAFLRRTSLDELPQFLNVLRNHMSVVGPRPHMLKHTEEYRKLVDKFMVRHFAKPGLTGWAQVLGYRGQTKTVKEMENRAYADIWYIENWSFLLDLKIIIKTIITVFFKNEENAF
jgi:undecaprenyl-phosphate galactose phosphotransferase/putative colanic acid biosynthesis UDP-glucose lipid carrier transferase